MMGKVYSEKIVELKNKLRNNLKLLKILTCSLLGDINNVY